MRRPSTTTADAATARLQTVPRLLDAGASGGPTLNGCLPSVPSCLCHPICPLADLRLTSTLAFPASRRRRDRGVQSDTCTSLRVKRTKPVHRGAALLHRLSDRTCPLRVACRADRPSTVPVDMEGVPIAVLTRAPVYSSCVHVLEYPAHSPGADAARASAPSLVTAPPSQRFFIPITAPSHLVVVCRSWCCPSIRWMVLPHTRTTSTHGGNQFHCPASRNNGGLQRRQLDRQIAGTRRA